MGITKKGFVLTLKNERSLIAGEKAIGEAMNAISKLLRTKIEISGRSLKTGRKKKVSISLGSVISK